MIWPNDTEWQTTRRHRAIRTYDSATAKRTLWPNSWARPANTAASRWVWPFPTAILMDLTPRNSARATNVTAWPKPMSLSRRLPPIATHRPRKARIAVTHSIDPSVALFLRFPFTRLDYSVKFNGYFGYFTNSLWLNYWTRLTQPNELVNSIGVKPNEFINYFQCLIWRQGDLISQSDRNSRFHLTAKIDDIERNQ